ncbi:helix-turn-helix domain-containing protein [Enterococcus hermanniensis]|uniref:HTH cro/C1-type domain-containing protein n=1 Tax=Enterococcus hermanniensis TaxID=249189 RepID=A0A1L8TP68_9ENTE|nr:helix-turn-helix transcriptional regulator [Enterococcus hermanniensis]OJG46023.1 hypothetical protein RV04_GL001789 [Enterococcus hermanniensis]
MNISFTEFGSCLGLNKPTISSYVQGYNLAPLEVIEKISKISGRSVGWFYFGDIEEYIADYFTLKGQGELIKAYPEVVNQIKEEFFTGDFKNPGWENEIGYPGEEFIDDYFEDILPEIMTRYVSDIVNEQVASSEKLKELTDKEKEEATVIIASDTNDFIQMSGEIKLGEKEKIVEMLKGGIDNLDRKGAIEFSEQYLIGKLINMLGDDEATKEMISDLSQDMTDKSFSTLFSGEELVEIFQAMRPALMKLYAEKTPDDVYKWFEN